MDHSKIADEKRHVIWGLLFFWFARALFMVREVEKRLEPGVSGSNPFLFFSHDPVPNLLPTSGKSLRGSFSIQHSRERGDALSGRTLDAQWRQRQRQRERRPVQGAPPCARCPGAATRETRPARQTPRGPGSSRKPPRRQRPSSRTAHSRVAATTTPSRRPRRPAASSLQLATFFFQSWPTHMRKGDVAVPF